MSGQPVTKIIDCSEIYSSQEIVESIVDAALEARGKDVRVLKVASLFPEADYFVLISGRSDRQVQGISNKILQQLDDLGLNPSSLEGLDSGQWVLIDCGDVIVHVFYEPIREHYDLESLWSKAPNFEVIEGLEFGE